MNLDATGLTGTSTIGVEGIAFTSAGSGIQDLVFPLFDHGQTRAGTYQHRGRRRRARPCWLLRPPAAWRSRGSDQFGCRRCRCRRRVGHGHLKPDRQHLRGRRCDARRPTAAAFLSITSTTYNNAYADGSNSGGGFVGLGGGTGTVNATTTNDATVGLGDIIDATLGDFTLQATSYRNVLASSDSTGGGVVDLASAKTTVTSNDSAAAQVGGSRITAGGNILIRSSQDVVDIADATTNGSGLGVGSEATTTTSGTTQAKTTIQGGANLGAGGNLRILATQDPGDTSAAYATGKGSAFGVHDVGNTFSPAGL